MDIRDQIQSLISKCHKLSSAHDLLGDPRDVSELERALWQAECEVGEAMDVLLKRRTDSVVFQGRD